MGDRLRLLWVTPYLPRRGVSAAQEYWWSLLARLAPRHDITLLAFVDAGDEGADRELPGLAEVQLVPRRPWRPDDPLALLPRMVAGAFSDPSFADAIATRVASGRFDLVQYEFAEMAHLIPQTSTPTILTVHQLSSAAEYPRWRRQGAGLRRGAVAFHRYLRELDFELRAVGRAHHVITVSPQDAERIRRFRPDLRISVSPVGVDCTYFRPQDPRPAPATDLLFVGNFGHPPNLDAVEFLVRDVLPRLGRPVHVRVVGRGVAGPVEALARPGNAASAARVEIAGAVPDLRPELAQARVAVAPVRFGTGMRGKVLEALAMERPVVTTDVGVEGLGARHERHLLIANDARSFARAIGRVLDDDGLARRLGSAGRQLVESRFDWDTVAAGHEAIYERTLGDPGPTPAWDAARGPTRHQAISRAGRWPAIALGTGLLAARALRWHVPRLWQPAPGNTARSLSAAGGNTSA